MRFPRWLKKALTLGVTMRNLRRVVLGSGILVALNFCCDNGWFLIGRLTEVQWWMTEIGIVFWSIVGSLVLEVWLHEWIDKRIRKHPFKVEYDKEADALYLRMHDKAEDIKRPVHSRKSCAECRFDLDDDGKLFGIEVLYPSTKRRIRRIKR